MHLGMLLLELQVLALWNAVEDVITTNKSLPFPEPVRLEILQITMNCLVAKMSAERRGEQYESLCSIYRGTGSYDAGQCTGEECRGYGSVQCV